jgi:hypothetical protein
MNSPVYSPFVNTWLLTVVCVRFLEVTQSVLEIHNKGS